jgi:MYXO-CTERM domain-containing protein
MSLLCASNAVADGPSATSGTAVVLRTVTEKVGTGTLPTAKIAKNTGSGLVDVYANFHGNNIGMVWTASDSTKNPNINGNDPSYFRGQVAFSKLTEKGLESVVAPKMLPKLGGERAFMRPGLVMLMGGKYALVYGAAEDNGVNNNNPQAVAWVVESATGNLVKITNSTRQNAEKPTNLIELTGQNDDQQYGPHSVCAISETAVLIGVQRQNQNAYVMRVDVAEEAGGVSVKAKMRKVVQNGQHSRPQIACPLGPATTPRNELVVTTVEANGQPANIGIRALAIDTNTLQPRVSKLIAASAPNQNQYAVQPTASYINDKVVAIQYQMSSKLATRNNGNAHKGGANVARLATFNIADFTKLDEATAVAVSSRHSDSCGIQFGPNAEPAAGVISGSITGSGGANVLVHPIDPATGKIATIDRVSRNFQVAKLSDVGGNAVRGKRNPNNQGRAFIRCVGGLQNPGFGKASGFMPEVKSFTVSMAQGWDALPTNGTDIPEHAFLSLIPASWETKVVGVPGPVTNSTDVKPGPSPTTTSPTSTNGGTSGEDLSSGDNAEDTSDPFAQSPDDELMSQPRTSSCSVSTGASSGASNFGLLGAAFGLSLLIARRRKAN